MKTKAFKKILGTFAVAILALGVGVTIRSAVAGTADNVFGFAWGGNEAADTNGGAAPNNGTIDGDESGLGWVSFNSTDCDTNGNGTVEASEVTAHPGCPAGAIASYGVNIPVGVDGDLSGYAWSEHYGWISFNVADLAGCPSGTCKAERVGDQIKGWARILSIRDAGVNAGGWSGWIQLDPLSAGTNATTINTMSSPAHFEGYAYSDELGWFQFNPIQGGVFHNVGNILQLCRDGVPIAKGGDTYNFTLTTGGTTSLTVYYDSDVSIGHQCDAGSVDVTASTVFTEANPTGGAVSLSGTNPKVLAGDSAGIETVAVTYSGKTVIMNATVSCVETVNCSAERAAVCTGSTVPSGTTKTGICGPVDCSGQQGTRYCDFNWKEVAPGQ